MSTKIFEKKHLELKKGPSLSTNSEPWMYQFSILEKVTQLVSSEETKKLLSNFFQKLSAAESNVQAL